MSRISPKLIDVEGNRVGTEVIKINRLNMDDHKNIYASTWIEKMKSENTGRFPTQLFTNIKNDRYKYVKNIT